MDTEIELKFKIDNISSIKKGLENLGYILSRPRVYELSVMYDNPEKIMQISDGRIRLRQSGDRVELAYKKPITREGIKQEIEYEVVVSDLNQIQKILGAMEYHPTTSYERHRTEYKNNSGTKITIDEYPFATFIEIEGEKEKIVKDALGLNLEMANNLTDSCDTLFAKWRNDKNLSFTPHMRFDDYQR